MAAKEKKQPIKQKNERSVLTERQRRQKKKLIRLVILICLTLIPLFVWFQGSLFRGETSLPANDNILIFAVINLNVLLVLLMLFLVLRNLAELLFQRRSKFLGTKLKTKLVVSFISLSLIPSILLFFVSLQFISTSMDYWFNANIESSLQKSLELARSLLQDKKDQASLLGETISQRLGHLDVEEYNSEIISTTLENMLAFNQTSGPDIISLVTNDQNIKITILGPRVRNITLPKLPVEIIHNVREKNNRELIIQECRHGDLVRYITPASIGQKNKGRAILTTSILVDQEQLKSMTDISRGIEKYRQMKRLKKPFKFWLILILMLVTLLIVFAAVWFGFYISRGITDPIDKLAIATRRVADGDLAFVLEREAGDEIGLLVDSFNTMTANLNSSDRKLVETLEALKQSSTESEQRRRYTETILQNVAAGVISLDNQGRITTINHFAENLLDIEPTGYIGQLYTDVLIPKHQELIAGFIQAIDKTDQTFIEQYLKIKIGSQTISLLINFTRLEDENDQSPGYVLVFDDLTKMEKMQRMAAWREVARRIAHEIKNPLTPIQLSAQRLRRRYPEIIEEENSIFDQCTHTIINQVDELKRLVSEFSQFARMPKVQKSPGNLVDLARDTLFIYQEAHKDIHFTCTANDDIPVSNFDAEQIKRCLINLIDNAVAAIADDTEGAAIEIVFSLDSMQNSIFIRIIDTGPGIREEDKLRLFEPYFSTKKSGTGLGLAIVSTIISDHNGYVRVLDNHPHGTIFTIELPVKG